MYNIQKEWTQIRTIQSQIQQKLHSKEAVGLFSMR